MPRSVSLAQLHFADHTRPGDVIGWPQGPGEPLALTEALVEELVAHNKQFTMMAYPNRSHSLDEGPNTRRHLFTLMTRFLEQHLPPGPRGK